MNLMNLVELLVNDVDALLDLVRREGRLADQMSGHDWWQSIYEWGVYDIIIKENGICETCARNAGYESISEVPTKIKIKVINTETGEEATEEILI